VGLVESEDAALRTVRVGLDSLKLLPGRGLTMVGAPSPFWDPPEEGGDVGATPAMVPGPVPKLELPRGSSGSSSLQPKVARNAKAAAFWGKVSFQTP
jgi:hypothetical protein